MSPTLILVAILLSLVALIYVRRLFLSSRLRHYDARELAQKLHARPPVLLLDVRTLGEHRSGHLDGAVHIPVQELRSRIRELEKHRDREIVVYCASGARSLTATYLLQNHGFKAVNLRGGIVAWNTQKRKSRE